MRLIADVGEGLTPEGVSYRARRLASEAERMKQEAMWMRMSVAVVKVCAGMAAVMVCAGVTGRAAAQSATDMRGTTYYLHGRIYTNDPKEPWAAAMAVRDGKILCVGTI